MPRLSFTGRCARTPPPEALRTQPSAGVWVPPGLLPPGAASQARTSFLEQMPGTSSQLHRPEAGLAPGGALVCLLERLARAGGLCHRSPPTPVRPPMGRSLLATAPGRAFQAPRPQEAPGGPHPHQVHTHVEQLEPQDQGETLGRRPHCRVSPIPSFVPPQRALSCLQACRPQRTRSRPLLLGHTSAYQASSSRSPGRFGSGRP